MRELGDFLPTTAALIAFLCTKIAYRMTRRYDGRPNGRDGFRRGQVFTSSLVALAHGTNDAQKTMGGWRIIRTLGKGLTEVRPAQGFAAETSTGATILVSSAPGWGVGARRCSGRPPARSSPDGSSPFPQPDSWALYLVLY